MSVRGDINHTQWGRRARVGNQVRSTIDTTVDAGPAAALVDRADRIAHFGDVVFFNNNRIQFHVGAAGELRHRHPHTAIPGHNIRVFDGPRGALELQLELRTANAAGGIHAQPQVQIGLLIVHALAGGAFQVIAFGKLADRLL